MKILSKIFPFWSSPEEKKYATLVSTAIREIADLPYDKKVHHLRALRDRFETRADEQGFKGLKIGFTHIGAHDCIIETYIPHEQFPQETLKEDITAILNDVCANYSIYIAYEEREDDQKMREFFAERCSIPNVEPDNVVPGEMQDWFVNQVK